MPVSDLFKTTVAEGSLDGSGGQGDDPKKVSDFLTVQSLSNFSVMVGAITAAWSSLIRLFPFADHLIVPYFFAFGFGVVSFRLSTDAFKKDGKPVKGAVAGAVFIGIINSLVLASAVVGAHEAAVAGFRLTGL